MRAVERISVDVDALDVFGQVHEAETIREPVGEIVGAELKPQARGNEVGNRNRNGSDGKRPGEIRRESWRCGPKEE